MAEKVSEHFGSAPFFTIIDLATNGVEIINNQNQHHDHGQCNPIGAITGKGIQSVVCNGMGRRAVELLNSDGIKVYLGNGDNVKTVIEEYNNGSLKELSADGACTGHGCH